LFSLGQKTYTNAIHCEDALVYMVKGALRAQQYMFGIQFYLLVVEEVVDKGRPG